MLPQRWLVPVYLKVRLVRMRRIRRVVRGRALRRKVLSKGR
jgi:hypothetical protein